MEEDRIGEVRGILPHQQMEPQMNEILQKKLWEFGPEADKYRKKSEDMKLLTALEKKTTEGQVLSKDELIFLYEINSSIEGFGYQKDPRIEELREVRNRQEDIKVMCDCPPEKIAADFTDIKETTMVYYEDSGRNISLFDFRREKNKEKLTSLIELAKKIKKSGSLARPDLSFEGGILNIEIDKAKVKDLSTALKSYEKADNSSPSYIWEELKKMPFASLKDKSLGVIVLSYNKDPQTRKSSDKIVADMDKLGLRPVTFEELIAIGIVKPALNKKNEYLVALGTKATLGGSLYVPDLGWGGGRRVLGGDGWASVWDERGRFLCVRKP